MKRELIVNSAAGVYAASAAAHFLLALEAAEELAIPDKADMELVKEIANRGDDAPQHYVEDAETLEQGIVMYVNREQAFLEFDSEGVWLLHD